MLYLGGGGSEDDEAQLWDLVFCAGQRITVWPYAMPPSNRAKVMHWITTALAKRGHFTIELGDTAPDFGLATADVLVIPGGNTFALLAWIHERSLEGPVKDFIARGGKVYGGSAGALLLGADIAICDIEAGGLDENNINLKDTKGFDLLGGAVVFPHFDTVDNASMTCQNWADKHGVLVIALPEKGGMAVDNLRGFFNAGPDDITVFVPQKPSFTSPERTRFLG